MKTRNLITALIAGLFIFLTLPSGAQDDPVAPFEGMWALSLDYEDNNAGWLEVSQKNGYIDSKILWRWGSVYPVDYSMIFMGNLLLVHREGMWSVRQMTEGNP